MPRLTIDVAGDAYEARHMGGIHWPAISSRSEIPEQLVGVGGPRGHLRRRRSPCKKSRVALWRAPVLRLERALHLHRRDAHNHTRRSRHRLGARRRHRRARFTFARDDLKLHGMGPGIPLHFTHSAQNLFFLPSDVLTKPLLPVDPGDQRALSRIKIERTANLQFRFQSVTLRLCYAKRVRHLGCLGHEHAFTRAPTL